VGLVIHADVMTQMCTSTISALLLLNGPT